MPANDTGTTRNRGIDYTIVGGIGCAVGVCLGIVFAPSKSGVLQQFPREGDAPAVIRHHREGCDSIYVAAPNEVTMRNQYISLGAYLETIENPYDRLVQEASIKKRVNW